MNRACFHRLVQDAVRQQFAIWDAVREIEKAAGRDLEVDDYLLHLSAQCDTVDDLTPALLDKVAADFHVPLED